MISIAINHFQHKDSIVKRAGSHDDHIAYVNIDGIDRKTARQTVATVPGGLSAATLAAGVTGATVFSRPTSTAGEQAPGFGTQAEANARQGVWLERGQFPSFEFDVIDDQQVLDVEAAQRTGTPVAQNMRRSPNAQTLRLAGIARDIQKMIETEAAFVLKELAGMPAAKDAASTAEADARKRFSLFLKHFQNAKLAAADAAPAGLVSEMTLALESLKRFSAICTGTDAGRPLVLKASANAVRSTLVQLAAACKAWGANDTGGDTLSNPTSADETGSPTRSGSEPRLRSVSSPEPVIARRASTTSPATAVGASSSPEKRLLERKAGKEQEKHKSPMGGAGKKLKALFSKSSQHRNTMNDGADELRGAAGVRSRSSSDAGSGPISPTHSMPDLPATAQRNAASSPLKSPDRKGRNAHSDS